MKTLATGFCLHRNAHKYESCIQTFTEYVSRLRGWCQSESEHGKAIFVTVHYWQMQKVSKPCNVYSQFKDRWTNSCTLPVYLVKFHTDGISEFPSSGVKKQTKKKKTEKNKIKFHNLVSIWAFASTTAAPLHYFHLHSHYVVLEWPGTLTLPPGHRAISIPARSAH